MSDSDEEPMHLSESESEESDLEEYVSDSSEEEEDLEVEGNWVLCDENSPPPPRFDFVGNPGPTFALQSDPKIIDFYQLFIDNEFVNIIVEESNRYAKQMGKDTSKSWTAITHDEIHIYLSIKILQGITKKPTERMYWTSSETFETPIFAKLMSFRRYSEIQMVLHFADNEAYDRNSHPQTKLNKIWPIFENFNNKCGSLYIPERDITIDESLMLYKGRLSWRQYLPLKRARFGIKIFCLCESKSGYLFASIIYTGKGTIICPQYENCPVSTQIVMALIEPLLNMGYCLTTDNYYTSPNLADVLVTKKTDIYGTVRSTRKEMPQEIATKKLRVGETISFQRGKIMTMKWKDKKDICLLSTVHNSQIIDTNKTGRDGHAVRKPKVVLDYNDTMGGVDRMDQHIHDYPVTRKRGKKFYKKIFHHIFDLAIWNAYVLYTKNGGTKSNLDFRKSLVEEIIEKHLKCSKKLGRPPVDKGPLRLIERHFPKHIPPTDRKATPTRCCVVCCSRRDEKGKKIRRETRVFCQECNVGLCAVPCFELYHTKKDF